MAVAEGLRKIEAQKQTETFVPVKRGRFRDFWRRFSRNRLAVVGLVIVAIWVFVGLTAPWISPYSYRDNDLSASQQMPSVQHWLGTDRLGRDQLSRLIWSARTALIIAPLTVLFSFSLGLFFGLIAGYMGGVIETVLMRLADVLLALPTFLFALLLAVTVRPGLTGAMEAAPMLKDFVRSGYAEYLIVILALSLVGWAGLSRLVRAQVLTARNSQYVEAARAAGAGTGRILWRHVLPNISAPIIVLMSMSMGGAIVAEVGLSFLGVGIQPPLPSWGVMLNEGYQNGLWRTPIAPFVVWTPGVIVSLLIFAFAFIGDGLNDALNPHLDRGSQ